MTSRDEAWRKRQGQVLTALRVESKRNRTDIANDAGLEYWQLTRLETGKSELPAKLIPALARAYGVTAQRLIDLLGLSAQPWSSRAEMEASGVVSPERIDQVEADLVGKPEPAQRARVAGEIALGPDPDARNAHETHTERIRTG